MKNKIILVDIQNEDKKYLQLQLGLLSVGNYLKHLGYEVKIIKIISKDIRKIDKFIDKNVLCVGIGIRVDQIKPALLLSSYVKKNYKDIKIIWGGTHVNLYPNQILKNDNIDIIVFGDGEYTISEIVKALQKGRSLKGIKGCGYKENNKIILNEKRDFVDISKLPQTNYSIIYEIDKYIKDGIDLFTGEHIFPILSGVGCPFSCTFCYNTTQKGRVSKRDINIILNEIEYIQKNYGVNFFYLIDEMFLIDKKRVEEFIEKKKKRKLNFMWSTNFHISLLKNENLYSDNFIKGLVENGMAHMATGVESGSLEQLKRYKKNITPKDVIKVVERLKKLKIKSAYSFMIGAPYEIYDEMIETVRLIYKIKTISPEYTHLTGPIQIYRPYPGAELYQDAIKLGYKEEEILENRANLDGLSEYHTIDNGLPYLKDNLSKIYDLYYYIKFVQGISKIKSNLIMKVLRMNLTYNLFTNKLIIKIIGKSVRNILENKLFDEYISKKIMGRSLILKK